MRFAVIGAGGVGGYFGAMLASAILDTCLRPGVNAEIPLDIVAALWKKFMFITGAGGITALLPYHLHNSENTR